MREPRHDRANAPIQASGGVQLILTLLFLGQFFFVCFVVLPRLGAMAG